MIDCMSLCKVKNYSHKVPLSLLEMLENRISFLQSRTFGFTVIGCLKRRVLYAFFYPQKTIQPFRPIIICLYFRDLWLKGLKCKPFRTIHCQSALECLCPASTPAFQGRYFLLSARKFSLSPWYFSPSAQEKFITNLLIYITNFVTRVTKFLTSVTKFVTKTFLYERKNFLADGENFLADSEAWNGLQSAGAGKMFVGRAVNLASKWSTNLVLL